MNSRQRVLIRNSVYLHLLVSLASSSPVDILAQFLDKSNDDSYSHLLPTNFYSAANHLYMRRFWRKELPSEHDDMEQWVTDTFYSYFPGFNNEDQKRQNYLRERQHENQQNLLKHQALNPPKNAAQRLKHVRERQQEQPQDNPNTARSGRSTASTTTTATINDKTDLEIIVNNPNYQPPTLDEKSRPSTTRCKLLQDLQHTDFSNMPTDDVRYTAGAISERNRRNVELESARKKDYQRDLLQQIEEKRRSIEVLREKERREDEAITRRLQEQLKTIKLEEQLEKERLRAEKLRFDTDQNRLLRQNLLAKLEQDTKLLHTHHKKPISEPTSRTKDTGERGKSDNVTSNNNNNNNNNNVYKYFSNSARHEYRRGRPLPTEVEFDLAIPPTVHDNAERECFHLTDKVCPMCDAPLRSYESCCLRCQRKLSLKFNAKKGAEEADSKDRQDMRANDEKREVVKDNTQKAVKKEASTESSTAQHSRADDDERDKETDEEHAHSRSQPFSLVCVKCERLYTLCPSCLAKSDVCRACNRKRHVCMSCRRALCAFCLDEVACGRDTERTHINEGDCGGKTHCNKNDSGSERSFQVLEVNYAKDSDDGDLSSSPVPQALPNNNNNTNSNSNNNNMQSFPQIHNNLFDEHAERPPYSMNIERNSIFHPDYQLSPAFEQLPKISDKHLSFDLDSSLTDEPGNIERVRKETDRRLSRYLKNYGDLAAQRTARSKSESRHRGTQTTPDSMGRRDIVLTEEHNLSMPLLREMPKMTRKESTNLMANAVANNQRKIMNLNRRWEIPAVQKFTISPKSPKVLTQVGAIRQQLQAQSLFSQSNTDDDFDDY